LEKGALCIHCLFNCLFILTVSLQASVLLDIEVAAVVADALAKAGFNATFFLPASQHKLFAAYIAANGYLDPCVVHICLLWSVIKPL
jgi:hypothetical protein